jgi:ribosomal protein S6
LVEVLKRSSKLVLENGGVVRSVANAGTDLLPYTMKKRRVNHEVGRYAFMEIDMGPRAIGFLSNTLKNDHDVIRHNIVKIAEVPGIPKVAKWKNHAALPDEVRSELAKRKEIAALIEERAAAALSASAGAATEAK